MWSDGQSRRLSDREAALLAYLVQRPGETVTRDALLADVWGYKADYATRVIDTTVRRLRVKIEPDPAEPVHLLSVFGEGYRFQPAPRTDGAGAVPAERTSLHGRDEELRAVEEALDGGLVTVAGPGGVGKTRLAQRVAARDARRALWCDLTGARELGDVVRAVSGAAGLHVDASRDADAWLAPVGESLRGGQPTLLVLDNTERASCPVGEAVAVWADGSGPLTILVTSRKVLGVDGEAVVLLDGLEPATGRALFVERARAAGVTDDRLDDPAVDELVKRLDGLPLALELAAVRCRMLSPSKLIGRLDQRFRLLATRDGDVDPRHRSLLATLDASWELLDAREREVLGRLSVSPGRVGPELRAVLTDGIDPGEVDAACAALCDASLVREDGDGTTMLESVRAYARRRLDELGLADAVEEAHGEWAIDRAVHLSRMLETPEVQRAADAFDALVPHLHQLVRQVAGRRPQLTLRAAAYLSTHAQVRGPSLAAVAVLRRALEVAGDSGDPWVCRARCALAMAERLQGRPEVALQLAERAVREAEPGSELLARSLADHALLLAVVGHHAEAMARFPSAIEALEAHGLVRQAATSRASWAAARTLGNDRSPETEQLFQLALAKVRELGMVRFEAGVRANYATFLVPLERIDEARAHLEAARETLRAIGARRREGTVLFNLAVLDGVAGDDDACERRTLEARERLLEFRHTRFVSLCNVNLAMVRLKAGEPQRAQAWLDEADQYIQSSGDRHIEMLVCTYRAVTRATCGLVSDAAADLHRARALLDERQVEDDGLIDVAAAFVRCAEVREAREKNEPPPDLAPVDAVLDSPGWGTGVTVLLPLLQEQRAAL